MIQHHGSFAIQIPANWTPPQFQFGQMVQVREQIGQITGLDYYTREQAAALKTSEGWWYWVVETRTLADGTVVTDPFGYHESVIHQVPSMLPAYYEQALNV